jgi:hypothetical protein
MHTSDGIVFERVTMGFLKGKEKQMYAVSIDQTETGYLFGNWNLGTEIG